MLAYFIKRSRVFAAFLMAVYLLTVMTALLHPQFTGSTGTARDIGSLRFLTIIPQIGLVLIGYYLTIRRPENPISWLFIVSPLIQTMDEAAYGYVYFGTVVDPGSLPLVELPLLWLQWSGRALLAFTYMLLFLLFPTGRPLSRRWGLIGWIGAATAAMYVVSAAFAPIMIEILGYPFSAGLFRINPSLQRLLKSLTQLLFSILLLSTFAGLVSLIARFIRSRGVERQQIKWFAYAFSLFIPTILLLLIGLLRGDTVPAWIFPMSVIFGSAMTISQGVASAIAILQYRLWEIDFLIRRTLIYSLLAGALAAIYFSGIVVIQEIFRRLTGQESQAAIVVSTLAIAAMFNPLRKKIQQVIDQRFFRKKYNAEKTLSEFGVRARNEVSLGKMANLLMITVQHTMQPTRITLSLNDDQLERTGPDKESLPTTPDSMI